MTSHKNKTTRGDYIGLYTDSGGYVTSSPSPREVKVKVTGNSIGLGGLVFLVFLALKLMEVGVVATWSWWWVTSPLWIPAGIVIGIGAVVLVIALIAVVLKGIFGA